MEEDEHVLRVEAEAAVKEIAYAVAEVELSAALPSNEELVYLNVKTKEGDSFCIELTAQGFRVVGRNFDSIKEEESSRYFETIYALLDNFSPEYRQSFGETLMSKLSKLQELQESDLQRDSSE